MELTRKSIIFFIFIAATISGPITYGAISLSKSISNIDTNRALNIMDEINGNLNSISDFDNEFRVLIII